MHCHGCKDAGAFSVARCLVARDRLRERIRKLERSADARTERSARTEPGRRETLARRGGFVPDLAAVVESVDLPAPDPSGRSAEVGRLGAEGQSAVPDQLGRLVRAAEAPSAEGELLGGKKRLVGPLAARTERQP